VGIMPYQARKSPLPSASMAIVQRRRKFVTGVFNTWGCDASLSKSIRWVVIEGAGAPVR